MALSIVGPAAVRGTASRGIPSAEIGIICSRVSVRYYPEVNQRHTSLGDSTVVRTISANMSRDIAVEGVISGATGIMAFTVGVALGFANSVTYFGPTGGTILLDEALAILEHDGWRRVTVQASSNPNI